MPNHSLLEPIPCIIQENVKVFDFDKIDRDVKRRNKKAFDFYVENFKNNFYDYYIENNGIEDFKDPICFGNDLLLDYVLKNFKKYIDDFDREYSCILLSSKEDERDFILTKLENRYSDSYRDKIKRRGNWLCYRYRRSNSVLLTLTIDPKEYGFDKFNMWMDVKKQVNRFFVGLKYHLKMESERLNREIKLPPYLLTIEAMKGREENNFVSRGNPHIHIVFFGASRLLDWTEIRDIWKIGHIFINRSNEGFKVRYPINYVLKYITKTYSKTNEDNILTQSLCWLFNIRSFSYSPKGKRDKNGNLISKGLIIPLYKKSSNDWIADGFCYVNNILDFDYLKENKRFVSRLLNPLDPIYWRRDRYKYNFGG